MPSSAVHTFSDPNEYGATVRAAQTEMTVTVGGPFSAKLVRVDLHRLWMQRFSDKGPRLMRAATTPERVIVCFPMQRGLSFYWGGREAHWESLFLVGVGQEVFQRSTGPSDWAAMSLPVDDFKCAVSAINHRDVQLQSEGRTILPAPDAMAKLRGIYAATSGLAESAPSVLTNPEAARSLEQELLLAMVACATDEANEDGLAVRHHHAILRRFRALIEANIGNPLYLHEICASLGVSNRTLQRCCQERIRNKPTPVSLAPPDAYGSARPYRSRFNARHRHRNCYPIRILGAGPLLRRLSRVVRRATISNVAAAS